MSLPWMRSLEQRGPVVGAASQTTSKKKNRHSDIAYPVFMKCAEIEDEAEWKEVFVNLAHGILPKGFSVRNKTLAYTDNSKTTPIRMDLEPEVLRLQLIDLFSKKKGLVRHKAIETPSPTTLPGTWKDVTKSLDRRLFILEYICSEGRALGWDEVTIDESVENVQEWMKLGYVRQNEVEMKGGKVLRVSDISLSPSGVTLSAASKKSKISIQRVHVSRLYRKLKRETRRKKEAVEPEREASESVTSA